MYPNEYCHRCEPELPPIEVPLPPVCDGEDCEEIYPGTCVKYTGPAIPCLNIAQNEDLNSILVKIANRLCTCCNGGQPTNCVVSAWSEWSACVDGVQTRTRTVVTPPANGGTPCPPLTETRECLDSCTPVLQAELVSDNCEQVEATFIDDGSALNFLVYLVTPAGVVIDTQNIVGSGTVQAYSYIFASVPAGQYFAKIEKYCEGQTYPISVSTNTVHVLQCIPPCPSTPFSVSVVDCETVNVTLDGSALVPVYDIEYRPSNVDVWTNVVFQYNANPTNVVTIDTLPTPGIQYEIRVRHWCDEGSVGLWDTVVVVLPSCPTPSCNRPSFTATTPVCDEIVVNLDGASSVGTIYDVEYRVAGGTWTSAATGIDASIQNTVTITGLTASEDYEVRVRRLCSVDLVSDWLVLPLTTPACATLCPVPEFHLDGANCSVLELNIGTTIGGINYFEYQFKDSTSTSWSSSVTVDGTSLINITPVEPGATYDVRVRRSCGDGLFSSWVTLSETMAVCP